VRRAQVAAEPLPSTGSVTVVIRPRLPCRPELVDRDLVADVERAAVADERADRRGEVLQRDVGLVGRRRPGELALAVEPGKSSSAQFRIPVNSSAIRPPSVVSSWPYQDFESSSVTNRPAIAAEASPSCGSSFEMTMNLDGSFPVH